MRLSTHEEDNLHRTLFQSVQCYKNVFSYTCHNVEIMTWVFEWFDKFFDRGGLKLKLSTKLRENFTCSSDFSVAFTEKMVIKLRDYTCFLICDAFRNDFDILSSWLLCKTRRSVWLSTALMLHIMQRGLGKRPPDKIRKKKTTQKYASPTKSSPDISHPIKATRKKAMLYLGTR